MSGYSISLDLAWIVIHVDCFWTKVHLTLRVIVQSTSSSKPDMDILCLWVGVHVTAIIPLVTVVILELRDFVFVWVEAKLYGAVLVEHGVKFDKVLILLLLHLLRIYGSLWFLQVHCMMSQGQVWLNHLVLGITELLSTVFGYLELNVDFLVDTDIVWILNSQLEVTPQMLFLQLIVFIR